MIYGYARCSTNEDRQDITRQTRELMELGAREENIYFEYESGCKVERARLSALLAAVKPGDVIVTTEVSRLTRSTRQLCDIIQLVQDRRLKLIIKGSITVDCTDGSMDAMTAAFLKIVGVFSELERDMISSRVRSGLNNARAKGRTLGRPAAVRAGADEFRQEVEDARRAGLSMGSIAKARGISTATLYRKLKEA